jgi:ligand-binding SRPBCC domain-containing protein
MPSLQPPSSFSVRISSLGSSSYELTSTQVLPIPQERAFSFFEDPRNLFDITPDWLQFVMRDREAKVSVFEGAEFDYTIRWLGATIPWRSRIFGYRPPERFTDIQVRGPYRSWTHLHVFESADVGGTVMRDRVTYQLPCGLAGGLVHWLIVRRQLMDIFRYRAARIDAWARGSLHRKWPGSGCQCGERSV